MNSEPDVPQGRSIDLSDIPTATLHKQLREDRKEFERSGGRGVDLAERIDCARFELRSRASTKAAAARRAKRRK